MPEKLRPAGGCGLLKASTLKVKLLENVVMEDEKPTQYLRRLQALAGSAVPVDLARGPAANTVVARFPGDIEANYGHADGKDAA